MIGKDNALDNSGLQQKQQDSAALPFLDHDFWNYHNSEWYQWEITVQLRTTGATQLSSANTVGPKIKALLVKLFTMHRKDNVNIFSENRRQLEVETFPTNAQE
eukprot:13518618-Ditylum_brightwellii.AAC.1